MRITQAFPEPPKLVRSAYQDLVIAAQGTEEQQAHLGPPAKLPRPWDPPTCPGILRAQVWVWLDDVADWINHEYSWVAQRLIPACWPAHPHIAHELAVLADQRYSAGLALSGHDLEEWHRYALPSFLDRMTSRLGETCPESDRHSEWPSRSRYTHFASDEQRHDRRSAFGDDIQPNKSGEHDLAEQGPPSRTLALVNTSTGEMLGQ